MMNRFSRCNFPSRCPLTHAVCFLLLPLLLSSFLPPRIASFPLSRPPLPHHLLLVEVEVPLLCGRVGIILSFSIIAWPCRSSRPKWFSLSDNIISLHLPWVFVALSGLVPTGPLVGDRTHRLLTLIHLQVAQRTQEGLEADCALSLNSRWVLLSLAIFT